jgi:hypothetical protein
MNDVIIDQEPGQMSFEKSLEVAANFAAVITACVALFAYCNYRWEQRGRRVRLERHLKEEKELGWDQGQRTVTHLMAQLGMTEAEVLHAAFQSDLVRRATVVDDQGRADALLFEYDSDDETLGLRRPF